MEDRIEVTLDFTNCKYLGEVYREMRTKMEWEDEYGENLDALWDILWGMPHKGDDFIILRPKVYRGIPYGYDESFTNYINKLCDVFELAQSHGYLTVQVVYTES